MFAERNSILPLTPALLIKTSILPKASQAFATVASIFAALELTSSSRGTARARPYPVSFDSAEPIRLLISSQSDCKRSTRRAAAMILQPAFAKSMQNSRPSPDDAPVTITTLLFSSSHGSKLAASSFLLADISVLEIEVGWSNLNSRK